MAEAAHAVASAPLMSFAEFCKRADLGRILAAGFRAHVSYNATFDYRTETEWDRLKGEFLSTARRRA